MTLSAVISCVDQVEHIVAPAFAAHLELGERPVFWPVTVSVVFRGVKQIRIAANQFKHAFCIGRPVSCTMKNSIRLKSVH